MKVCGKQNNRLAEISDYIGKRKEMEQRNLVPVDQHPLAHTQEPSSRRQEPYIRMTLKLSGFVCLGKDRGTVLSVWWAGNRRWRRRVPPKRRLTFNGLHGVIPQETELFITIAVRTSNPTD
jgi:hypothetical protein